MKFLTEDFLLQNRTAQILYHEYAKDMPIFDYHCHLPPADVAQNTQFRNLTHIWLAGDHYKWRAMRANGVNEKYITGDAGDWEKFEAWAATVPYTVRNPLYHWTHLELKRPFGITGKLLSSETAKEIYDDCNALLATEAFRARGIMQQMNVKIVCTTDDPIDSLEYHQQVAQDADFSIKMLPAFRPDKIMAVESPEVYHAYLGKLEEASGIEITNYDTLLAAVKQRHDFFHKMGCRLSDHGIETAYAEEYTAGDISRIFEKIRSGKSLEHLEILQFKSAMLIEFAYLDHAKGWTQQYHFGALRNNNSRLFKQLGPDTGFDSIGDFALAQALARFLDRLDSTDQLAKTIIYNINPNDNELLATMIGNFQDGSVPGKMQFGSGWWFLDQKDGMEKQMNVLSNMGLLSRFIGMLTDSRSFLSYPRHEYFRRILCNLIGTDVENGELPDDMEHLGQIVQDICYNNAVNYLGITAE
ncbi:glucuronate isomerase [candidate division KSB3 bacterium]|uniref:Uronate isomerase n=1 Tax=candidate division KSB3 bacterium TaxID=2044937 RepID=A0A2G6KAG1_9BACT|nr:MAG: glucuronate isomerase [candidate division KSB3 bacterium]